MRHVRKRYHPPGTAPGTLRAPEVRRAEKVVIHVISFGPDRIEERDLESVEEAFPYRDAPGVTWIDVTGLHDLELLRKLGEHFGLHPLALEDVLNVGQRPKIDDYETHQFIVMKEPHWDGALELEQVSLFLGKSYVISFQEMPGDCFDPIRERIRKEKGRMRKMGADYLAYALIDELVDESFPVLEKLGERIEELEEAVLANPTRDTLLAIRQVKHDLLYLRRAAWPQREVIHAMQREDTRFVHKDTRVYLRDLYDHAVQILDIIESYRDLVGGMFDVYLSSLSNRMNEIMKVLTIISTIFIPLTFIAGVYGMNFDTSASPWSMPELHWRYGYLVALTVMGAIALAMLLYFRRRKWF